MEKINKTNTSPSPACNSTAGDDGGDAGDNDNGKMEITAIII